MTFWSSLKRWLTGPTNKEINARVIAEGGPGYPIPPMLTIPPTTTTLGSTGLMVLPPEWVGQRVTCTCGGIRTGQAHTRICDITRWRRRQQTAADTGEAAALDRPKDGFPVAPQLGTRRGEGTRLTNLRPAVERIRDGQDWADQVREAAQQIAQTGITSHELINPDLSGDTVTQPDTEQPGDGRPGGSYQPTPTEGEVGRFGDPLPGADPTADTGSHHLPNPEDIPHVTAACPTCKGAGTVTRPVSDVLRETVGLIPVDHGDDVIREFYRRLLTAAPALAPLFPADLLTAATNDQASPGAMQRDKLLQAIVALSDLYGAGDEAMSRLDTALGSFGRSHAAFQRPDGTVRGATLAEYVAVKETFLDTCTALLGEAFTAAHAAAWDEAIDYAAVGMLYAQQHSGMKSARYPRTSRDG